MTTTNEPFLAARLIKEIGRGKNGARSMSRADAHELYAAMLAGRVSQLELGGILLAMRIKGESVDEIAGFLDAAEAGFAPLAAPAGPYAPVVIPSYNGARKMANLTPLLAGVRTFVGRTHGLFIDGDWRALDGKDRLAVYDPANGAQIASVVVGSKT